MQARLPFCQVAGTRNGAGLPSRRDQGQVCQDGMRPRIRILLRARTLVRLPLGQVENGANPSRRSSNYLQGCTICVSCRLTGPCWTVPRKRESRNRFAGNSDGIGVKASMAVRHHHPAIGKGAPRTPVTRCVSASGRRRSCLEEQHGGNRDRSHGHAINPRCQRIPAGSRLARW